MVGKCTSRDFGVVHGSTPPILLQRREHATSFSWRARRVRPPARLDRLFLISWSRVRRVAYIWTEWANYLSEPFVEMVLQKRPNGRPILLGLEIGYEHCPYAELWPLADAFRVTEYRLVRSVLFTERISELFAASFFVSFVVMARGDISVLLANVPEDMDWVEDVVLLSKSVVDEELLASFREARAVCSTVEEESKYELVSPTLEERVCYYNLGHPEERHFIYMYECLFSKLGVRVPFTQFEQDVLFECRVAPTQLHSNSWGFMKAFQSVCWYLQLDLSLRAFFYFFHLTRPFSQKKSRWDSFRAREGRRIFSLYEESFHDFKNYYFKARAVEEFRPFFENERGEYQFRLYWYSGPESPKFDFNDLDKEDQEVVTMLKECCTKAPFNTKTFVDSISELYPNRAR
ncbi:hypothetical protein PIB30_057198 [Stylosanthes scabra]|uniref:Uncharacterized protein n=1 Tax=Stylosanthes scabra TaxID=79078 RepID=A0ABU6ULZ8_9FABA|nr:hypothetical protein [Stylosanthes scabra]